jgi:integrase
MLDESIAPGTKETFADFPLDRITPRHCGDRKVDLPGAADNRVRALRGVFKWAVKHEHMSANPAIAVEYVSRASDGWHSWTSDELAQFERRHPIGSKARLALALLMYTGVRRSDVVQLGPQHVRDGWLKFRQSKTKTTVDLPTRRYCRTQLGTLPSLALLPSWSHSMANPSQ